MVLSRSLVRQANYLRFSHLYSSQKTRYIHLETSTEVRTKPKPRRSKKKLQDLPECYILPNGTPAKPLGDWRLESSNVPKLIKDTSSSSLIACGNEETQDASGNTPLNAEDPSTEDGSIEKGPTRKKRTSKITPQVESMASDSNEPVKRSRRSKKAASGPNADEAQVENNDVLPKPRTVLAQEIHDNLHKFPHCLLLTRVGQFYESYFNQAEEIASLLNIKLTSRKWSGSRVPMCGFPLMHLDKHLRVLVQQHKRFVAMCEEFPVKQDFAAKEFERRVTRIITPGTLIDEPFLNAYENNFLLAISTPPATSSWAEIEGSVVGEFGLAWIDVSTGEFYSKNVSADSLQDELARINPREVVLPDSFKAVKDHPLMDALVEEDCFVSFIKVFVASPSEPTLAVPLHTSPQNVPGPGVPGRIPLTTTEQAAVDLLTSYLNANLLENMPPLTEPLQDNTGRMQIDAHTIKALEIREMAYEGGTRGSLFNVIKRTITNGGTRLLSRWLCSPSTSISEIQTRQSLVELFLQRPHLAADMTQLLMQTDDTSRLTQKFLAGRGDASDLLAISRTIRVWSQMASILTTENSLERQEREDYDAQEWTSMDALVSRMDALAGLSETIDRALGRDGDDGHCGDAEEASAEDEDERTEHQDVTEPNQLLNWKLSNYQWSIRPEFSTRLQSLHDKFQGLLAERDALEKRLQADYSASSLTLRASPGQGIHVHLARKRDQSKMSDDSNFVAIYESGSTKCFFYQEWSYLGNQIIDLIDQLIQAEKEAFQTLRNLVNQRAFSLRKNTQIMDELDVVLAFAKVADELKFTKPIMTNGKIYDIVNGRHPSVEIGLLTSGRVFTPNSVQIYPDARVHIITGPNMAGKSTFLRQTAVISILAQVGSFVPAEAATIGIVDKVFSRIGAKDDLFRDRSTFMVEMLETADILKRATDKSLVIMDEVGRGTTVNDGLAIAFAAVHHLVTVNQCRTLFATHFHELAHMLGLTSEATGTGTYRNVQFYCTDVSEIDDDYFAYSYRIRPGVNWDSHGLKVAQLAGLPDAAIEVASDTLNWLRQKPHTRSGQTSVVIPGACPKCPVDPHSSHVKAILAL